MSKEPFVTPVCKVADLQLNKGCNNVLSIFAHDCSNGESLNIKLTNNGHNILIDKLRYQIARGWPHHYCFVLCCLCRLQVLALTDTRRGRMDWLVAYDTVYNMVVPNMVPLMQLPVLMVPPLCAVPPTCRLGLCVLHERSTIPTHSCR